MSSEDNVRSAPSIWSLIWIPAVISLGMTLLRLTGELLHWSEMWFSSATGGVVPVGLSWIFGITWLPLPFGIYFALRLRSANQGPPSRARAVGLSFLGAVLALAGLFLYRPPIDFPVVLLYAWAVMAVGAAVQFLAWPELARVMSAYGLAARIPVVVVMFLAMLGNWGTHYDYVGMPAPFQMPFWPGFFWLAFFPQLVFWVSHTIILGVLSGSIAFAFVRSAGGTD
ncbi:MAG: hypothetical protein ACYSWU_06550 [Planctomycetota bacterium]